MPSGWAQKVMGVLNSTVNFVLGKLAEGTSLVQAVQEAQRQGFAEDDPSLDLEGWDSAAKVAALANVLMDAHTNPLEVERQGLVDINASRLAHARRRGNTIKLVCRATRGPNGLHLTVRPEEVPLSSPMGAVTGTSSVLTLNTDLMGKLSIFEHDPSITQTAYGVISDLIHVARVLDRGC